MEDVTGECRKLCNEELHDVLSSPITILSDKNDEVAGVCGTCVWRREMHAGFWWRKLEERGHLEGPDIDERIIFQWILKK